MAPPDAEYDAVSEAASKTEYREGYDDGFEDGYDAKYRGVVLSELFRSPVGLAMWEDVEPDDFVWGVGMALVLTQTLLAVALFVSAGGYLLGVPGVRGVDVYLSLGLSGLALGAAVCFAFALGIGYARHRL